MQCRCGWLCKESGCTWKVSLLEETSEHSCQKRPRNLTTLTKRSRRFVTSDTLTRLGRNVHARYWQKKEQFFRLVVSFPSQGFHWSGNGKGRWKFLRARKSQGILFWVRKTWYFEETSGWFGAIEGWKKHSGSLWSQRSQWSYWRRKILLNNYPS